jgi:pilus assembly protein CpaB
VRSKGIRVVAALLLATLGTLVLVRYVETARAEAVAAEQLVDVLVVGTRIDKGTAAADIEGKVRRTQVPAKVRATDAVTEVSQLADLFTTVDLRPGEQVVRARFATAGTAARGEAPKGLLQVTVSLDPERALGGNIRPADTVGVLLSFDPFEGDDGRKTGNTTHLELHKVLVTDVQLEAQGGGMSRDDDKDKNKDKDKDAVATAKSGKYLVTLAIEAPAVEQVVFTAEHGFIWLSAEPKDAPEGGAKIVDRGNVYTTGVQ